MNKINTAFYLRLSGFLLGILALSLISSTARAQTVGETIGEAYDLNSKELLYRETHCVSSDAIAREVIYHDDDGQLLARKRIDYSSGATTPSFVQRNLYSRETIEVVLKDDTLTMSVLQAGTPGKTMSTRPTGKMPLVIDAGFDEFVRDHWDQLVAGNKKYFQFPFAERKRLMKLRIRPTACSYRSESDQCFKLELSNWFMRMLAAPIELGYDANLKRLTRYRGLSNIGDGNGNGQVVDIHYNYADVPQWACRSIDTAAQTTSLAL